VLIPSLIGPDKAQTLVFVAWGFPSIVHFVGNASAFKGPSGAPLTKAAITYAALSDPAGRAAGYVSLVAAPLAAGLGL
jgi:hypothetical protein